MKIEFTTAVAVFLILNLLLVFVPWIFYTQTRIRRLDDQMEDLVQCPVCTHTFHHYRPSELMTCPRCRSFISRGDNEPKEREYR